MRKLRSNISYLVVLVSVATAAFGCFITNCPPGGKRSNFPSSEFRQCESCGPNGAGGRCYGPNICCSSQFGCLIGTPATYSCYLENRFTTVCKNPGAQCSGSGNTVSINGQCAGDGICCSSETCTLDENCLAETSENTGKSRTSMFEKSKIISEGLLNQPQINHVKLHPDTPQGHRGWHLLNSRLYEQLLKYKHDPLLDDLRPHLSTEIEMNGSISN